MYRCQIPRHLTPLFCETVRELERITSPNRPHAARGLTLAFHQLQLEPSSKRYLARFLLETPEAAALAAASDSRTLNEWLENLERRISQARYSRGRFQTATEKLMSAHGQPAAPWQKLPPMPTPPHVARAKNATDLLMAKLAPVTERAAETAAKFRQVDTGPKHSAYITPPGMPACFRLDKLEDGKLECRSHGEIAPDIELRQEKLQVSCISAWAQGHLMELLEDGTLPPEEIIEYTHPAWSLTHNITHRYMNAVDRLTAIAAGGNPEGVHYSGLNSLVTKPALTKAADEINHHTLTQLVSETNRIHREAWFAPAQAQKISAHNWVELNEETFVELERKCRGTAKYFLNNAVDPEEEPQRLHPGQVINRLKRHTGLDGAAWKVFCRMGPAKFMTHHNLRQPHNIRDLCEAIAQANVPYANPADLHTVALTGAESSRHRLATNRHGNPWKRWVQLIGAYLRREHDSVRTFSHVVNAFSHQETQGDAPWGPGEWETHARRADRWHRELERIEEHGLSPDQLHLAWESALEQQDNGELTLKPENTAVALVHLAETMHNCIATVAPNCATGMSRIYTIWEGDTILAAAEIRNSTGRWTLSQVEAPNHGSPEPRALELAKALPELYASAERSTAPPAGKERDAEA